MKIKKIHGVIVMLFIFAVLFFAPIALAHHPEISGTLSCTRAGEQKITWTIGNSESNIFRIMRITAINRTIGVPVNTLILANGHATGSETFAGNLVSPITLTVTGRWAYANPDVIVTQSVIVALTGQCSISPTPTTTPTETPSVTPTVTETVTPTITPTEDPVATPSATITETPNNGTGGGDSPVTNNTTTTPICQDGDTVKLPANPHVYRSGATATVNFFITEGNSANIYWKEVNASDWQHSSAQTHPHGITPNIDNFVSYPVGSLDPNLGYTFGIEQKFGCGGGQTVIAVIVDGPETQLFPLSYWIWSR